MSFMTFTLDGRRDAERWDGNGASASGVKRKRFWCHQADRDVEVLYLTRGVGPFRWISGVKSCTAFDPKTEVTCARKCVDVDCRRRWEIPLSNLIQK